MRQLWQKLNRTAVLVFAVCVLGGCASYQPTAQVSPDFKPRDSVPALPEMAAAHRSGAIEFFRAPGVRIPARVFGTNGTRRPIIMTHGLESHSGWFVQSAAFMAELGHPVYLVDRRGSGLSREKRGHCDNYLQWSKDLEAVASVVLDRHRTDKLHVIGHCFGAIPAAMFTIRNSNLVASLILPTPAFFTDTDLTFGEKLHVLGDHLSRGADYLPVPLKTEQFSNEPQYQDFIRNDELKLHEVTTAFYWSVNDARKFVRSHIDEVRCPVWLGLAGKDEIVKARPTQELFRNLGSMQKQLIIFPEAKHILEFSPERDRFFSELQSWLAER
jgi:acylglycerol lipase